MKVKLDDILEAFELNDRYSEYFLDEETGEVVQVNDMMMTQDEKAEMNRCYHRILLPTQANTHLLLGKRKTGVTRNHSREQPAPLQGRRKSPGSRYLSSLFFPHSFRNRTATP